MKQNGKKISLPDPAQIAGVIFLTVAIGVFFISSLLAVVIAFTYILLCILACFFPRTNFLGPVIGRGNTGKKMVALTIDDGPTGQLTIQMLELLDKYSVPATFFVSGINAERLPEVIRAIIAGGHTVGNHSFHHYPFLMLRSSAVMAKEISATQDILKAQGIRTFVFRPPVGIVNPGLFPILEKAGMSCVTFSCRAFDAGNRRMKNLSRRILKKVKGDDIILLHDALPRREEDQKILLKEMDHLLSSLTMKGFAVVPLSVLIGKEIMTMDP